MSVSDDELKKLVELCRKRRQQKSFKEQTKDKEGRIYVNRNVLLDTIKFIGFDMDHTLVVYKSPEYDILAYELAIDRLVSIGYPKSIKDIKYNPSFAVRGLFFDRRFGNLLKLDAFGNILSCCHGFTIISPHDIRKYYPNKYIQPGDTRLFNMDTLYHYAETYLISALVDYFDSHCDYTRLMDGPSSYTGVQSGDIVITYQMIQQDVRDAIHWSHTEGDVKKRTIENLEKYVQIDSRFPSFIKHLYDAGIKLFVATNSGYDYTMKIMSYLFKVSFENEVDWRSYFEFIIVDAKKPLFFQEGSMLREIDETTGSLRLGRFTGSITKGKVFSGGSSDTLRKIARVEGKEILYVGDHIFGDIIKSKKEQAFRTFLVVPELNSEITTWENTKTLFARLQKLEYLLSEMYQGTEISKETTSNIPIDTLRKSIKETAQNIESMYPHSLGSLLRCGSRLTYFANQVSRFADLYSSTCVNLINYPTYYLFSSQHQLMAHESSPLAETISTRQIPPLERGMSTLIVDFEEDSDESNGLDVIHENK